MKQDWADKCYIPAFLAGLSQGTLKNLTKRYGKVGRILFLIANFV